MKALLFAVAAVFFAGCFNPTDEGSGEDKYSSKTQEIVVCSSDCAPPTYDGNPVACASNIYCYSDAAGAYCLNSNNTWSSATCRTGTTQPYCGDGICNGSETWQTCNDCPQPIVCGDGICNGNENQQSCAADCAPQPYCGDGICQMQNGEGGWNCRDCCPAWQQFPCAFEP